MGRGRKGKERRRGEGRLENKMRENEIARSFICLKGWKMLSFANCPFISSKDNPFFLQLKETYL